MPTARTFDLKNLTASQILHLLMQKINTQRQSDPKLDALCQQINPCLLHNNGQAVIGLFPKSAWILYPNPKNPSQTPYILNEISRTQHTYQTNRTLTDKDAWLARLITYCQKNLKADMAQNTANPPQYIQGLMGFIGYDLAAQALNPSILATPNQPLTYLAHYDLGIQKQGEHWQLIANGIPSDYLEDSDDFDNSNADFNWNWLTQYLTQTLTQIENLTKKPSPKNTKKPPKPIQLHPIWNPKQYQTAFNKVQAYLKAGDTYQINLTQCWQGQMAKNQTLFDHLTTLERATQAPYFGYLSTQDETGEPFELLSCSPELFFTFEKTQTQTALTLTTKPIKGTRPRHPNPKQDNQLKTELAQSEKDQAENLMIVDLLRNDLGKYAQIGTVKTPDLFTIESFANVHHMVSRIHATLSPTHHPLTILIDSLPAGSITGTPKKRAVEIIHELENQPRGAYCGSMGYLNFDGTGQWNVLIRTLQTNRQNTQLWAGGGITILSESNAEYQESQDKITNLLTLLAT